MATKKTTKSPRPKRPPKNTQLASALTELTSALERLELERASHHRTKQTLYAVRGELIQVRERLNEVDASIESARGEAKVWKAVAVPLMRSLLGMVPANPEETPCPPTS